MRVVRQKYDQDVPPELVQQTLDRIAAQSVDAEVASARVNRRQRPAWFGIGLAAGLLLAFVGTWQFLGGGARQGELTANSTVEAITVRVPDPAASAGNCVRFLLESDTKFAYSTDGDAVEVRFLGSENLSDNMKQWLLDRSIQPPAAGAEMKLRFVRAA
jgi:hypothetical protein